MRSSKRRKVERTARPFPRQRKRNGFRVRLRNGEASSETSPFRCLSAAAKAARPSKPSRSAQWEHTILVTETGYDVLTVSAGTQAPPAFVTDSVAA